MDIEMLRSYCLAKAGVSESFPFGQEILVFKVGPKIFLLTDLFSFPVSFNVKCDPEKALERREKFDAIQPGYHMNKNHWNTVIINGSIKDDLLFKMMDESYDLVLNSIPKSKRNF